MLHELVRTERVVVGLFRHESEEPAASLEWWAQPCVAFTAFGQWWVRSRRGSGQVAYENVLVSAGQAEYECRHPHGMADRMLCVLFRSDIDLGATLLHRQTPVWRSLRKILEREVRSPKPQAEPVDDVCMILAQRCLLPPDRHPAVGQRIRGQVARLKREMDTHYRDQDLDIVACAASLGLSRTRMVHAFADLVGTTPHRHLVNLRVAHAARLLTRTTESVTDICFASGFGSLTRFHAAFRDAYQVTPSRFRDTP